MNKLNAEQQQAVDSDSSKIICLAGAGAGKTATMISRISRLVDDGVNPHNILVLTFTNAAAFEMRTRYKQTHQRQVIPEFKTFHSFCYTMIVKDKKVRNKIGYVNVPVIVEPAEMKQVRTSVKLTLGITVPDSVLYSDDKSSASEDIKFQLDLFNKGLKKELRERNIITFDVLCRSVSNLFVWNDPCILKYKEQYEYIFVDEFQDTDPNQVKFLESFESSNFFFVGDVLQCQPAGTKVRMSDNTIKNIEDIVPGDKVYGFDTYESDFQRFCDVLATEHHHADDIVEVKTAKHSSKYSKEHLTYVRPHSEDTTFRGYHTDAFIAKVKDLRPTDMDILTVSYNETGNMILIFEQILDISDCSPEEVYSLSVRYTHNYIADGILTHNCIYQFRGCSNETIKKLTKDDSWRTIKLYQNYRSTKQICEFANRMSTYAEEEYRITMNGQRDGESVQVVEGSCIDWKHPVDNNHMHKLVEMLENKDKDEDVAILCRTNKEVDYVCETLDRSNIQYRTGKQNKDKLHIMKSVVDNEYMLDWLSTFLSAEKYGEFIRLHELEENPNITWFIKLYGKSPKIYDRGRIISNIRKILRADNEDPAITKCFNIIKELDIDSSNLSLDDVPESPKDIWEYIMNIISQDQDSNIYVGTIHSSKGLEYDSVYVVGVDDKCFPLSKGEEMLNLYYVAITRAKNHLVVFRK